MCFLSYKTFLKLFTRNWLYLLSLSTAKSNLSLSFGNEVRKKYASFYEFLFKHTHIWARIYIHNEKKPDVSSIYHSGVDRLQRWSQHDDILQITSYLCLPRHCSFMIYYLALPFSPVIIPSGPIDEHFSFPRHVRHKIRETTFIFSLLSSLEVKFKCKAI